jgi:hypothetical protein
MIVLFNNDTNTRLREISPEELAFLQSHLEEESLEDQDYYIASVTVEIMERKGEFAPLVHLLRESIGESDGAEFHWELE